MRIGLEFDWKEDFMMRVKFNLEGLVVWCVFEKFCLGLEVESYKINY